MSSSYYSRYEEQDRQHKAEARKHAPKACPHCGAAINEHLSEWDKPRYHCGGEACRAAASRANRQEQRRQERERTQKRLRQEWEQLLPASREALESLLLDAHYIPSEDRRIELAAQLTRALTTERNAIRCKHPDVSREALRRVEVYARSQAQRAKDAEARIDALEAELAVLRSLENTIHGIVERQPAYNDVPYNPAPQEEQAATVTTARPGAERDARRAVTAAQPISAEREEDEDEEPEDE